jgi:hypothetical protein
MIFMTFDDLAKRPVTWQKLLFQVYQDWIGKEVQTGYTYTYVWMANQLGHFALGFLPTILVLWVVAPIRSLSPLGLMLALPIGSLAFWIWKEVRDFLRCVRMAQGLSFSSMLDRRGIALDAATAVGFIALGILLAYLGNYCPIEGLLGFFIGAVVALGPSWYWLQRRFYFQQAALPLVYRLAFFPGDVVCGRESVKQFCAGRIQHMTIVGPTGAGKTSLALAIGTELSFRLNVVRYLSLFKLLEFIEGCEPPQEEGHVVWPWQEADILIIDDVDVDVPFINAPPPSIPERRVLPEPDETLRGLACRQKLIIEKRTLWVLGTDVASDRGWYGKLADFLGDRELSRVVLQGSVRTRAEKFKTTA